MHEIGTHMIEIQIAEVPMKLHSFCKYLCKLFTQAWSGPVQVCLILAVMAS